MSGVNSEAAPVILARITSAFAGKERKYILSPANPHNNHSTIKPTNALYFISMSNNPTHVSAATEPSSMFKVTFTSTFTVPFVSPLTHNNVCQLLSTVDNTDCYR
jgi:hypothetical protein